jgi:hypothetical protein
MQPVLRMCATRCKFYYIGRGRFFKGDFAQNPIVKRRLFRSFSDSCTPIYFFSMGICVEFSALQTGISAESGTL